MTAATLSLPYRLHPARPADEVGIMEHAVEALVSLYTDALHDRASGTAEAILDGLHRFRPDLTIGRLRDGIGDLCRLSAEVAEFELRGESRSGACVVAEREYQVALAALAKVGA